MAYAKGPYAVHSSLPSPSVFTLHSSRKIDPVKRRYVVDENGNPEAMPSTRQRVILQLDFAQPDDPPKFIDDTNLERRNRQNEAALATLVAEGAISVDRIEAVEDRPGVMRELVDYVDRNTGVDESVEWSQ
jgi:hypothetical protein